MAEVSNDDGSRRRSYRDSRSYLNTILNKLSLGSDREEFEQKPDAERVERNTRQPNSRAAGPHAPVTTQIHPENCDSKTTTLSTEKGSVSNAEIHEGNIKLHPWLLFLAWSSGVAFTFSIVSGFIAFWEIREAKQVQIQLTYANAIMLRDGLLKPGDLVYGPEGNLEFNGHGLTKPQEK